LPALKLGGSSRARNLWENIYATMTELKALRIKGGKSFWVWTEVVDGCTVPLGFMAGHVDDFHLAGNENSPRWQEIKLSIDTRYRWGTAKLNSYRHAGTDLEIVEDPAHGRYPVVDQSFYIEKEITACPASIGTLQWLAVQTQPLICARCNLLITELAGSPKVSTAQEIQEMIRELRKHSTVLKFFKLPRVQTWKDVCVVGLGDQPRPQQ
jgi:hypothetical protein